LRDPHKDLSLTRAETCNYFSSTFLSFREAAGAANCVTALSTLRSIVAD
jgi:hypothetical protein